MNCTKCEVLVHALIDDELDAGHTSDVETHVATCFGCTENLKTFRAMREAMAGADLKWTAPAHLCRRIEAALPLPVASASAQIAAPRKFLQPPRRTFVDVAPPVIDLTAEGFTLLGGRLDYVDGEPVASIVYERRKHVINLFVAQRLGVEHANITGKKVQGYNVRHWAAAGLNYWAVSDLDPLELNEFVQKISTASKWSDK